MWDKIVLDLADHAWNRATSPSEVIRLYAALIIFFGQIRDEIGTVTGCMRFI